jgi:hypothetical protein
MKQTLNEELARIKSMMNLNEQVTSDLKTYLDELLKDPVAFVNKLNTDEQFKSAYGASYKDPNVDWDLLEEAKLQHILNNRPVVGVIKNKETNQIVKELTINGFDEYTQINQKKLPNETLILNVGKLAGTPNGAEVATALNVPLQISQKNPNYIWFK